MPCLFLALIGSLAILQSTLLTLAYAGKSERKADQLLEQGAAGAGTPRRMWHVIPSEEPLKRAFIGETSACRYVLSHL